MPAPTGILINDSLVSGTGPHVALTNFVSSGQLIGTLGAQDTDAGDSFTYALLGDANGLFFLSGNQLRRTESGVLDPNAGSYSVQVQVTDSTGGTFITNVVVGVSGVTGIVRTDDMVGDDTLNFQNFDQEYIIANAGNDTLTTDSADVVVFSGSRSDYSIVYNAGGGGGYGGYGGYGSGDPASVTITDLRSGGPDGTDIIIGTTSFLFEDGQYSVSSGGDVTPANLLGLDGRQLTFDAVVQENGAANQVLGQLTATGFDPALGVTVLSVEVLSAPNVPVFNELLNTGSQYLTVNAQGQLVTTASFDFESFQSHSVRVTFLDPNGVQHTESLFVQVTDNSEAPVALTLVRPTGSTTAAIGEHSNRLGDVEVARIVPIDTDGSTNGYSYAVAPEFADDYYIVGDRLFLREGAFIDAQTGPQVSVGIIVQDLDLHPDAARAFTPTHFVTFERLVAAPGETDLVGTSAADVIVRTPNVATVHGGDGNDVIVANLPNSHIRWTDLAPAGSDISGGLSQSFGAVTATIDVDLFGAGPSATVSNGNIFYRASEPFVDNSYYATGGEAGPTSLLTISFDSGGTASNVSDVTFRLLDVDIGGWQDIVTIRAFNAAGQAVTVQLTGNGEDSITGNTVTGEGSQNDFTDLAGSILVTIAGSVSRIEIDYSNGLPLGQVLGVSDVHFNLPGGQTSTGATLFGDGGNDFINATNFADTLSGGDGDDTINALSGNDNLDGGLGNDSLNGDGGNDSLTGGDGDDVLNGGVGSDTMAGGAGNDSYIVNLATDVVTELSNQGTDTVNSAVTWTLANHFENLTLTGGAAINGTGNSVANVLTGNLGANTLAGLGGNDTIIGGSGNDRLIGGAGADSLSGGVGNDTYQLTDALDTVTELAGEGTDLVQAYIDYTLGANLENLYLYGSALIGTGNELGNKIIGTTGANTLNGMAGNDFLYGGAGNDVINGGAGRDQLFGEAGADVFVFDDGDFGGVTSATADYIRDFSLADGDTIDLSAVDAIAGGADNAFTFIGNAAFSGTAGELRFQTSASSTTIMGDINGDGVADFWIVLSGVHALDQFDFGL